MVAMNTLNPFLNFVLPKEQTLAAFTCGQGSNSNAMKRKRVVRSVVVTETAKRSRVEVAEESRKSAKGAKSGIASSTAAALRSLKDCAYQVVDSPIGRITMVGSARGLHALLMTGKNSDEKEQEEVAQHLPHRPEDPLLSQAAVELEEYFNGLRRNFSIPLAPLGGTQFQRQVWESLRKIPYGETWSTSSKPCHWACQSQLAEQLEGLTAKILWASSFLAIEWLARMAT